MLDVMKSSVHWMVKYKMTGSYNSYAGRDEVQCPLNGQIQNDGLV